MLLTIILVYLGPAFLLLALGVFSVYLTYSGYITGRTRLGWAILGISLAVFFLAALARGSIALSAQALSGELFYLLLLGLLLALQAPLVVDLIAQEVVPDPSRGLKLIKVYSEAEKKVVQDDLPGAIAEYEKVLTEDPGDVTARFRLAELYCQSNEYRKAAAAYEVLLKESHRLDMSEHCSALTRVSEIYAQHLHDVERARGYLQTIIEKYPGTKYAGYAMEYLHGL